jgi:hypothetical protein
MLRHHRLEQFSSWRTRRSLEVAASGQPLNSMAAMARFCNAPLKSGGVSALSLALMFAPSLACRLLSRVGPRASGVGARARGCSVLAFLTSLLDLQRC